MWGKRKPATILDRPIVCPFYGKTTQGLHFIKKPKHPLKLFMPYFERFDWSPRIFWVFIRPQVSRQRRLDHDARFGVSPLKITGRKTYKDAERRPPSDVV